MPHASIKLTPGVDQNRTPALNEAAISTSQLIRFVPDTQGIGLPQKLGGWTKFYPNSIGSTVRAMWAWADTNINNWLAIGAESSLDVINNGSLSDITPRDEESDVAPNFSTTSGSSTVTIIDANVNPSIYDSVFIQTPVSVGGLVLFGTYICVPTGVVNEYTITARNELGELELATATVANGGAVPQFDTTNGSALVDVTLNDHGYSVGDTFTALVSTAVGGVTIYGNYIVQSVTSANVFIIQAQLSATSTATADMNNGDVHFLYHVGYGPLPLGEGYGSQGYGEGGYGTGIDPTTTGTPITADDWTLDNWGETLIAVPFDGPIYEWNPTQNNDNASVIWQGPSNNYGAFVAMPQRQIVAYGSTVNGLIDPLLVRWCDVENYTVWDAAVTNQAGSYRIPRGSKIVGGIQGPQQGLLWTDLALWAMQYTGQPYVYSFNEVATGCGLIGRKAAGSMAGVIYWMSQSQFFRHAGDGVSPIFCPIWDVIFQDIDTDYVDNIRIAPNARFNEIAWYYPTVGSSGVPTKYVKYNVALGKWDFGTLSRTAWIDQSVLGPPIGAGSNQYIYQHETSTDADGQPMSSNFRTGYFAMDEADVKVFVDQVWPDMKWGYYGGVQNANVQLTFYVTDYPGDTPIAYGPFTLTQTQQFVTPRFRGRLMAVQISSNDIGSFWRLGNMRYRFQPDGKY
jgi:hypothetical protein